MHCAMATRTQNHQALPVPVGIRVWWVDKHRPPLAMVRAGVLLTTHLVSGLRCPKVVVAHLAKEQAEMLGPVGAPGQCRSG